jgi:RimJ/RimL family protein N-acetyltransferase
MQHNLKIEGFGYWLRPVGEDDAEFIVEIRTADPERMRFLHPIPSDVSAQREWIARYLQRDNDCYWVVQRLGTNQREGVIGIYNVDPSAQTAEWGRWVLRPGSMAAAESALLIYRAAFECLKLESVYCLTVADNQPVVSFHDSCGLKRVEILKAHFKPGEKSFDVVKHILVRQEWKPVRDRLAAQAQLIAQRLNRNP